MPSVIWLPGRARAPLTSKRLRPGYPRRRRFSSAPIAPAMLALVLLPACYSPTFADGKLVCANGGACPSGFSCRASDFHCWRDEGPDAGSPRGADASKADADQCPVVAMPGCMPQTTTSATCDPFCQTGCGCNQKCSARSDGTIGCLPSLGEKRAMDTCTLTEPGAAVQSDNCAAGSICLRTVPGTSQDFCFALCRSDADCSGVPCVSRQITMSTKFVKVCDLPASNCDPIAGDGDAAGCIAVDGNRPYCFLVASTMPAIGRTVCEYASGAKIAGVDCVSPRDCFAKFTCPPAPLVGSGFCHRVCDPLEAVSSCPGSSMCRPWGPKYGYCVSPP